MNTTEVVVIVVPTGKAAQYTDPAKTAGMSKVVVTAMLSLNATVVMESMIGAKRLSVGAAVIKKVNRVLQLVN